jgi:phosphoserine phosphatase RsbU/P
VRSASRALTLSAAPPSFVLARLNSLLLHERSQLVTALFMSIHRDSGMLVVGSAGHPAPIQLREDGTAQPVALIPGPPLGAFADSDYQMQVGRIEPGEAFVLYTDGVSDARNGSRFFGERGAMEAVQSAIGLPAQGVADKLRDAVRAHADELRDDVHVLVVRRLRPEGETGR